MNDASISLDRIKSITLPLFLTKRNKYPVGIFFGLLAAGLYLTSNHFHLFTPRLLPMSWVDEAVPFLPGTVWIYLSEYIFFGVVYILTRDMANTNRYLYSFMALQTFSVMIFWLWPTTFPRDAFPLIKEEMGNLTFMAFSHLRQADSPANCCPSLHVSSCYLSSFIFLDEQREKFPFFFMWATAVAVTTLTTKQHYLIDVVAGFILAVLFYWLFHRAVNYRSIYGDQAK